MTSPRFIRRENHELTSQRFRKYEFEGEFRFRVLGFNDDFERPYLVTRYGKKIRSFQKHKPILGKKGCNNKEVFLFMMQHLNGSSAYKEFDPYFKTDIELLFMTDAEKEEYYNGRYKEVLEYYYDLEHQAKIDCSD
jgi:hypothetical protein